MNPMKVSDRTGEPTVAESFEPVQLANATLGEHRHVCGFFHSSDEAYRVLLPLINKDFERSENAFHVVNPRLCDDHLRRLESAGIAVTEAEKSGQLELRDWVDAYFSDGSFDQNRMLALFPASLEGARQQGFPQTRLICNME